MRTSTTLSLLASVALIGCAGAPEPLAADGWPAAEALTGARTAMITAPTLTLTVDAIVPGDDTTFTISGAGAGEEIKLARSLAGTGAGPCLGSLGGLCLDITNPSLHASVTADLNGTATLVQTIPETVPIGADVWFQAVVPRGTTGTLWVKSAEVHVQTEDAPLTTAGMVAGDLRITEVMVDPDAVSDAVGEWLEVHNVSGLDANLDGLTLTDGVTTHSLSGTTFVAADERIVLGVDDDPGINGGVVVRREVPLSLADSFGELLLLSGSTLIDGVGWDDGTSFPLTPGRSLTLADGEDHLSNDLPDAWCTGKTAYGAGDFGTPGAANSCEPPRIDLADADSVLLGEQSNNAAGFSVAIAGDTDGDGVDDLIVGAPDTYQSGEGWAYLQTGLLPASLDLGLADVVITGAAGGDYAGMSVDGAGDVNGDGFGDLVIGASWSDVSGFNDGRAYLVHGPVSGPLSLAGAAAVFEGEATQDRAGQAVSGAGDVNGDGFDDLLIGAPEHDLSGLDDGVGYLVYGPVSGTLGLGSADARFLGESSSADAGTSLDAAGDVNGDGFDDVLVGAPGDHAAYLLYGPLGGDIDLVNADARILGGYGTGTAVLGAGDLDGDGFDDVVVGEPANDEQGTNAGAVHIFFGPLSGDRDVATADAQIFGRADGHGAGESIAAVGDIDGDGFGDLLVGAPGADTGGTDAGAAYLVRGPFSGERSLDDARVQLVGGERAEAGTSVAAGDLDGDGLPDLVVGAPEDLISGTNAGAAYVVLGSSLSL